MGFQKQVSRSHYKFEHYLGKARWNSIWHQLDEVIKLDPNTVLEIGPGPDVFKNVAKLFGIKVETLDIDPELEPDYVASVVDLPFSDGAFDMVCAFQVLEHLPYEESIEAFREIARVSDKYVIISLPDVKPVWHYQFHIPKLGKQSLSISRPFFRPPENKYDREHYWEINKRGFPLSRIVHDFSSAIKLVKTYQVVENPYHRFFVFGNNSNQAEPNK